MALPARDHRIPLEAAAAMTRRYRDKAPDAMRAGAFHADQVSGLLAQKGCVALRIYYGTKDDGSNAFILVGVDSNDHDLTNGIILEVCYPCPPFCNGGGL
jgi:hypothetical protein